MVPCMDKVERRVDTTRILGTMALIAGLLVAGIGLVSDTTPAKGHLFAALLV